jgi:FAD:protein FMN transferase
MVEIGGEVRTGGLNPQGRKWRIGIEQPDAAPGTPALAIALSGESVSTSGDYRDFFELDGRRYSHTFDPLTGRPVEHGLASVTVLADDCMRADALATALHVLGPQAGFAFAEREAIPAYFIVRAGEGFETKASAVFARYIADAAKETPP